MPVSVCGTPGTSMISSGDVARGELLADGVLDLGDERLVEDGAGRQVDEEGHPVAAVGLFDADDEGFLDLGEAFDGFVDVGGAIRTLGG